MLGGAVIKNTRPGMVLAVGAGFLMGAWVLGAGKLWEVSPLQCISYTDTK